MRTRITALLNLAKAVHRSRSNCFQDTMQLAPKLLLRLQSLPTPHKRRQAVIGHSTISHVPAVAPTSCRGPCNQRPTADLGAPRDQEFEQPEAPGQVPREPGMA
ncbi:hypothetical protein KXW36_009783 [Aspergillus fumigatus]|nr:hypothetical protein KXW36_009783 [Aspergillus fumigatus]